MNLYVNHSDAWLRSTAAVVDGLPPMFAPRLVYLDRACEVFALVSSEHYAWVTQWRWKWVWDRTKTKRYAKRTPRLGPDGRCVSIYMHKAILTEFGRPPPSDAHTIGDHQDGESLNNQIGNLEWATASQNRRNRKR